MGGRSWGLTSAGKIDKQKKEIAVRIHSSIHFFFLSEPFGRSRPSNNLQVVRAVLDWWFGPALKHSRSLDRPAQWQCWDLVPCICICIYPFGKIMRAKSLTYIGAKHSGGICFLVSHPEKELSRPYFAIPWTWDSWNIKIGVLMLQFATGHGWLVSVSSSSRRRMPVSVHSRRNHNTSLTIYRVCGEAVFYCWARRYHYHKLSIGWLLSMIFMFCCHILNSKINSPVNDAQAVSCTHVMSLSEQSKPFSYSYFLFLIVEPS